MSNKYTIEEANQITLMLRQLATIKDAHPILAPDIEGATNDLVRAREFITEMIDKQEDEDGEA